MSAYVAAQLSIHDRGSCGASSRGRDGGATAIADVGAWSVTIAERFCGPAGCGNGGYTCGTVAAYVNANPAVVRLQAPVPLGHALDIVRRPDGEIAVTNGESVLARARPAQLAVEVPEAPSIAELDAAMSRSSFGSVGLSPAMSNTFEEDLMTAYAVVRPGQDTS